ncbi:hypothetical protein JTB14_007238 [Gonioctena quinquepunctata]|nr:hypothetical protein JTB14_007238 [Gonioctena quinquepunctata]
MMANNLFRQPKKASEYCVVCSHNSKKNPQYSYFRFPKDEARFRVCSAHFENHMFSSIQKNKLKRNAVPTIFVNAQHSTREDEAASGISGICMQTSSGWESVPSTSIDGPNSKSAPGTSITEYNPEDVSDKPAQRLSLYHRLQQMVQRFWQRWSAEYLTNLQQRYKWKRREPNHIQIGDVVVLKESGLPPLQWKLGRIVALHPGNDKVIRVEFREFVCKRHPGGNLFLVRALTNPISASRTSIAEYNPEEVSTQTPTSLSKNTPRKVHLRNKIRVLQRKSKEQNTPSKGQISREEVVEYVRQNSSPALASFLETQLKLSGKSPKGLRPFMGSEEQIEFLEKNKTMFREMRVLTGNKKDVTNRMKFIKAWQITISAILSLWPILKEKGLNKLFTRRLNQDCLENFFGKIRQQSGNCKNPTPIQFQRGFKKLFALGYFEQTEGTNCLEEFDEILTHITPEVIKRYELLVPQTCTNQTLCIDTNDYSRLDISEKNAFTYVCGYFIKKCLDKHKCNLCLEFGKENNELNMENIYSHFRAYPNSEQDTFGNLQCPNTPFIQFVDSLENNFSQHFPQLSVGQNVGKTIKIH